MLNRKLLIGNIFHENTDGDADKVLYQQRLR